MESGLFDALPDALLVVDAEGRILRANANAHHLFGHSAGGLVGLAVEALMPETARGRHREHRIAYAAAPRVRPMGAGGMTLVGQRRNGEQFPVEIALAPLDASSESKQFLASVRDISETLRARQALERARYDRVIADLGQDALEARSPVAFLERLPHALAAAFDDDVHIALWLRADNDGPRWVSSSDGTAREIDSGLPSRFVTQEFRVFNLDNDDSHAADLVGAVAGCHACALAPLLDRNDSTGALIAWSVQPSRFDHDAQHLLQSSATLVSAVLQRSRTEAQLAHAQRLDSLGQLTGGIAHDFNNLLTVMSGSLQLLAAERDATPGSSALIESALRAVRRGADLTDKLLSFGRRKQLRPAPIDAARLLEDIRVLLQRTLSDNVQLEVVVPMGLPPTFADAGQMDSALVNLALNARDAMPQGGTITLSVEERWVAPDRKIAGLAPGHYVAYSVADTGTGMSPDIVAHAIEPFFSTKGGRGSGLGLSMVYGFVQQSGGGMTIDSTAGTGTRVTLYLPVAREALASQPSPSVPVVASSHNVKALIVEDDAEVRAIASAFARSLGYEIVAVQDYDAALARLEQDDGGFDVVFSDLMLGVGPDGAALAELVRKRWPAIGVVVTSGHAHGLQGEQAYEILQKPYDREQLAAALSRCRRSSTAT